ncbi:hypothetical protein MMC13_006285 [Lambiella insularis]|nr:hypothetical protein [Lambiella insularis]
MVARLRSGRTIGEASNIQANVQSTQPDVVPTTTKQKKGKRKLQESDDKNNEEQSQPTKKRKDAEAPPSVNLQRRLIGCWRSKSNVRYDISELEASFEIPHSTVSTLGSDAIQLAIASVWQGLADRHICYSYGDEVLFDSARSYPLSDRAPMPASNYLIIPLFFKGKRSAKAPKTVDKGVHQWPPADSLLAIARKHDGRVRFVFMYSHPINPRARSRKTELRLSRQFVEETVQKIVNNCGWLPDNSQSNFEDPVYEWRAVPTAISKGRVSTVGHHLVLNAWAYMLDIPLLEKHGLQIEEPSHDFYLYTGKLIQLALDGRLDGQTIRNFMYEFEYARREEDARDLQRLNNEFTRGVLNATRSILMNRAIFQRALLLPQRIPPGDEIPGASPSESQVEIDITTAQSGETNTLSSAHSFSTTLENVEPLHNGENWQDILEYNLAVFEARAARMSESDREKCLTVGQEYLDDRQVHFPSASVWHAMWEVGAKNAIGTESMTSASTEADARTLRQWVIGLQPMRLVVPLRGHGPDFTHGNEYNKTGAVVKRGKRHGGIGHWVLVVAEMDKEVEDQVVVRLINSIRQTSAAMWQAAEDIIRYSGWLGMHDDGPAPFNGTFKRDKAVVPLQQDDQACGFHVIMAAWATLLEIPITKSQRLRDHHALEDFYEAGRRVINCVLAGQMDTRTIQAFLNAFGFSEDQSIADQADAVFQATLKPVVTDGWVIHVMDEARLELVLAASNE